MPTTLITGANRGDVQDNFAVAGRPAPTALPTPTPMPTLARPPADLAPAPPSEEAKQLRQDIERARAAIEEMAQSQVQNYAQQMPSLPPFFEASAYGNAVDQQVNGVALLILAERITRLFVSSFPYSSLFAKLEPLNLPG